jgi:hypothetical protein
MLIQSSKGVIRFNRAAEQTLKQFGGQRVLVLWEPAKRVLTLQSVPGTWEDAYPIALDKKTHGMFIFAKSALKLFGWTTRASVTIPLQLVGNALEATIPAEHLRGRCDNESA